MLAYLLYCIAEKLRHSDKLDRLDEEFFDVMLNCGLYRDALEKNGEKLNLFLNACQKNGLLTQVAESVSGHFPF